LAEEGKEEEKRSIAWDGGIAVDYAKTEKKGEVDRRRPEKGEGKKDCCALS